MPKKLFSNEELKDIFVNEVNDLKEKAQEQCDNFNEQQRLEEESMDRILNSSPVRILANHITNSTYSQEDYDKMLDAIENPKAMSESAKEEFKKALETHSRLVQSDVTHDDIVVALKGIIEQYKKTVSVKKNSKGFSKDKLSLEFFNRILNVFKDK